MSTKELRELDVWIASYIFMFYVHLEGEVPYISNFKEPDWKTKSGLLPEYTTDPAAALTVLEKCAGQIGYTPNFTLFERTWIFTDAAGVNHKDIPTLPLAICLFAKKLFGKEAK